MSRFSDVATTLRNDVVDEWKRGGGRVLGTACLLTPVEVLDAAGLYPFRLRGAGRGASELADARMSRFNCSFCRACLGLGLDGTYDFLDGLVETNGCDQLRGMFEGWQHERPAPFFHYLKVPHLVTDEALGYYELELRRLVSALEEGFGVEVTDGALREAMARQERIRELLRRLSAARERARPALSGVESLEVHVAGSALPPRLFEELLGPYVEEVEGRSGLDPGPRLLLGGAATDEVPFVGEMEALGAVVVADTLCLGSRAFWPRAALGGGEDGDPLAELARLYLASCSCPRMYDEFPARLRHCLDRIEAARVDGAVLVHNKFCDVHGIDNALLRLRLEERGVPVLALEKEYGAVADRGRMRTRVQAFLERLEDRR